MQEVACGPVIMLDLILQCVVPTCGDDLEEINLRHVQTSGFIVISLLLSK